MSSQEISDNTESVDHLAGSVTSLAVIVRDLRDEVEAAFAAGQRRTVRALALLALPVLLLLGVGGILVVEAHEANRAAERQAEVLDEVREISGGNRELLEIVRSVTDADGEIRRRSGESTKLLILRIINENRSIHGLPPLTVDEL